jgi:hypothetical protein
MLRVELPPKKESRSEIEVSGGSRYAEEEEFEEECSGEEVPRLHLSSSAKVDSD